MTATATATAVLPPRPLDEPRAPLPLARHLPLAAWQALALVLLAVTANRWGSQLTAWFVPVALLVVARRATGRRQWGVTALVVLVGTWLQVVKMVSAPITPLIAFLFALPACVGTLVVMGLYRQVWRRGGEVAALVAFPSLIALSEWASATQSELGVWGTSANTQLDNLALLQLASLVGVAGIGFLMAWVAGAAVLVLDTVAWRGFWKHLLAPVLVLLAANLWGSARVHAVLVGPTLQVAAVVTELGLTDGIPPAEALRRNEDELFARTTLAAQRGARLVAWNEAATFVEKDDEARLVGRGSEAARRLGVDLVLAYAVIESREPRSFANRYAWFSEQGQLLETYDKHHPVPGEPSLRGSAPIAALARPWGPSAGAICYDYDFPDLAREHARLGAVLAVVPSSDWQGIDPYHTQMTRVRAIEGGFAVLRPVRWATSAAYDALGRTRGTLSAWEDNDHVLVASVPVTKVPTLYARLGDAPVLVVSVGLLLLAGMLVVRRRPLRGDAPRGALS